MKKWFFRLFWALIGIYLLVAVFVLPYLIRTKAPEVVHEITGGTLSIDSVSFNPIVLNLTLEGVRFSTPGGEPLFALRQLDFNLDVVHLLWGRISIEYIRLLSPELYIVQQRDGSFNFDWLMHLGDANATAEPTTGETNTTIPDIVLQDFELEDGRVNFTDLSRPEPLRLEVAPIGLSLTDFKTAGQGKDRFHFYAGTGSSAMLDVKGTVGRFEPFAVKGEVEYNAGKLYLFYHFLQSISKLEVADGRLHFGLTFDVDMAHPADMVINDINASLQRLRIKPKQENGDVLRVGALTAVAGPVYPMRGEAEVGSVTLDRAFVGLERLPDGTLNWQHFFPSKAPAGGTETEANATNAEANSTFNAVIRKIALTNALIRFKDSALSAPATLTVDDANLTLAPVSTELTKPIRFVSRFTVNKRGSVDVNGSVIPEPLHVETDVHVDSLSIVPFSPYVEDKTYARIDDGKVFVSSHIVFTPSDKQPDMKARGNFKLSSLLVNDTRDGMPLASIGGLEAKNYLVEVNPNRLFIDTVGIDAPYANVIVDRNRSLNFAALMKPEKQGEKTEAQAKPASKSDDSEAFPVRIVRVLIGNGAVHFADESLPLPFDTQIHDVKGEVLGISSSRADTTFLNLDGVIDRYGVARAGGSLNTAAPKAFTDISLAFRNIDLHSLTPYSGKFVGRAIDQGKLTVALRYKIVKSKMKGENGLVINQIKLGKTVKSKDAVSLPLDFAIALLEDRDGVIDIDMPVRGDVDNPDFKWGGVVWKAFVNLLTKAVTAPFDLIGAMLGIEGDTLKYIPFEAGSAVIDAASQERLDLLADALDKRPKLGITIQGTYNSAEDSRALKLAALIKEVVGTEAKEKVTAKEALVPGLLEPIYEKRAGKEALEALKTDVAKNESDEVTRAQIYTQRLIDDLIKTQTLPANALAGLAQARETAIRNYLMSKRFVEAARMKAKSPSAVDVKEGFIATQIGLDAAK